MYSNICSNCTNTKNNTFSVKYFLLRKLPIQRLYPIIKEIYLPGVTLTTIFHTIPNFILYNLRIQQILNYLPSFVIINKLVLAQYL